MTLITRPKRDIENPATMFKIGLFIGLLFYLASLVTANEPERKPLPVEPFKSSEEVNTSWPCDSYFAVELGPVYIKLNSPGKECDFSFIGSRRVNCTASFLCDNSLTMDPADCDSGFISLSDGTSGKEVECGKVNFDGTPRYAANGGHDLYVKFKGSAAESTCVAFCLEDVTEEHENAGIKKPKQIRNDHNVPPAEGVEVEESCLCGEKRSRVGRIIGGDEAAPFEFPWNAAVTMKGERISISGATLISDQYALTAASSLYDENDEVFKPESIDLLLHAHVLDLKTDENENGTEPGYKDIPGYSRPAETDESEKSVRVKIEKIIIHPLHGPAELDWDIAILQLADKVDITSDSVRPICLPAVGAYMEYPPDIKHTTAGWGVHKMDALAGARVLQKLEVPVKECDTEWMVPPRFICGGYMEGGKDTCVGDAGGALVYKFKPDSNQHLLTGLVSHGTCGEEGGLGRYTDVQEFAQWIHHQIAGSGTKLCKT